MEQLKRDLKRSGHELEKLEDLEPLVYRRYVAPEEDSFVSNTDSDSLVFPVNYMREIPELRKVLKETERIVQPVLGDTTFKVATRKGTSIGNRVLRNSAIGKAPVGSSNRETQKCTSSGCKCCSHMGRSGDTFNIQHQ